MIRATTPKALLFVPGDRPERFEKAAGSGADAVVIDLEDAVTPEQKIKARDVAAAHRIADVPVFIRINASGTAWFEDDLAMCANGRFAGIMIPKATAAGLAIAAAKFGRLIPLIETADGVGALGDILKLPNILCAAFGALDLALDLGCAPDWEPLLLARSQLVLQSRLAGIAAPIDGVATVLDDLDTTRQEAERARALGFGGKLAIHPKQVMPIKNAFRPSDKARAWAEAVLAGMASHPNGAFQIDGVFVDRPVIEQARAIMAAT